MRAQEARQRKFGLTPRELVPAEYPVLLELGIGLTDLDDRKVLRRKVRDFEPRYLAFNGKRVAQEFFGLTKVEYGLHSRMGATGVFIVPSTSAAAKGAWDVAYWRQLAKLVEG